MKQKMKILTAYLIAVGMVSALIGFLYMLISVAIGGNRVAETWEQYWLFGSILLIVLPPILALVPKFIGSFKKFVQIIYDILFD